jgi:hypothetical protein
MTVMGTDYHFFLRATRNHALRIVHLFLDCFICVLCFTHCDFDNALDAPGVVEELPQDGCSSSLLIVMSSCFDITVVNHHLLSGFYAIVVV